LIIFSFLSLKKANYLFLLSIYSFVEAIFFY